MEVEAAAVTGLDAVADVGRGGRAADRPPVRAVAVFAPIAGTRSLTG